MTEWRQVRLEKIAIKITDGSHHSPKELVDGIPMYSVKDMREQGFYSENAKTISESDYQKLIKSGCQPEIDDILIAKDGSVLKHIFRVKTKPDYVLLSSIAIIRPDKSIVEPSFLVYAIKEPSTKDLILNNFVGGSGVPRIVLKDFKQVDIPLPPLPEQRAIASVLSSLDDKIDLLLRQNKTLEQMAETLFRQWFVEDPNPEWEERPLGELVTVKRGGSPRPIQDYLSDSGYRWLKISDATKEPSPFIFEIKEHIKEEGLKKTTLLKAGKLVLSNSATPGLPKILQVDTCIHDGWLHFPKSHFSNEFLYLLFKKIRPELLQQGNGSIFTNLKTDILKEYPIPIADDESLKFFDNQVKPLFVKLLSNQTQIRTLEKMRDTLLPKLMSGEVRVLIC
jgi:type I restriction enzyme, S subunit